MLSQALRVCQIALQEALEESRKLRIENETLKAAASGPSSSSSTRGKGVGWAKSELLVPHAKELIKESKRFVVMHELWPHENAFLKPCPATMPTIKERYASLEAYTRYITFLLYANASPKLHGFLENLSAFKDGVS